MLAFALGFSGVVEALSLHRYLLIPITLALTVPVVFRRKHPVGAFAAVIVVGAVQVIVGLRPAPADLSILVMLIIVGGVLTAFASFFIYLARRARMFAADDVADVPQRARSDVRPTEGTAEC